MWPDVTFEGKKGDMWMCKGDFQQRFVAWKAREAGPQQARLAVENGWFDGDRHFVKEDVDIVVQPAVANRRALDFTLRFEALDKPVQIVGTSEGKKGFGGFCFRFAPRDGGAAATDIRTDAGPRRKTRCWDTTPGPRSAACSRATRRGAGSRRTWPIPPPPTAG